MVAQPLARLRNVEEADFESLVALNAAVPRHISPMDLPSLAMLHELSSYQKVAEVERRVAGFLLALRERTPCENDSYSWFSTRYQRFIYVDRLVVAPEFSAGRIGTELYGDLFAYARTCGLQVVAAEYGIEPPDLPSKALHDDFGFREVSVRRVHGTAGLVSLQVAYP